jgi:hypothetical protein
MLTGSCLVDGDFMQSLQMRCRFRAHRVVDDDERERTDGVTAFA